VRTGFSGNGLIEITEGLSDDDNVVTVGQIGLKPDASVTVINAPDDSVLGESSEEAVAAEGDN
jgi:hypothetical protein